MMIKSILGLIFITSLLFSYTVHELNNPTATVFDITQDPTNLTAQSVTKTMQAVDKIRVAVDMITQIFPREVTQYQCGTDIYNTTYCPKALTLADTYWSYSNGSSIHHTAVVVDNETGTSAKYTGTVIDYVNGTSQPHTNTETNYSNGTAATYNGSVIDYTAKTYTPINSNGTATANTGSVVDYVDKIIAEGPITTTTFTSSGTFVVPAGVSLVELCMVGGGGGGSNTGDSGDAGGGSAGVIVNQNIMVSPGQPIIVTVGSGGGGATTSFRDGTNGTASAFGSVGAGGGAGGMQSYQRTYLGNGQAKSSCAGTAYAGTNAYGYEGNTAWGGQAGFGNGGNSGKDGYGNGYGGGVGAGGGATLSPHSDGGYGGRGEVRVKYKSYINKCPTGYTEHDSDTCKKTVSYTYYNYLCSTGIAINAGGNCAKTDPNQAVDNTTTLDDACNNATPPTNNCSGTTVSCALGYTDNTTNCKKTIGYNYYSYGCPTGYAVQNAGLTSCPKTDPNQTVINQATLDDACNNATPPANNCVQTLNTTAYEYICGTGYTPLDDGETACPVGSSGDCNSATAPTSNCKKTISYDYYSYGCDPGYSPLSHGLSTCSKTDPDTTKNNEATLNDNCNSPTPPANNCSNSITYSYYEYVCPIDVNEQEEGYIPTNAGLTSCSRTDPNGVVNNSATLDDNCNSATSPANNCKQLNFKCNSNVMKPALINNTWQCSPYYCDSSNKCATAECVNGTPQVNGTSYDNSPLNGINNSVVCNSTICDAVANERLGRCGLPPKCPTAFGVYASSGNCYQDVCPPNSTERELGGGGTTCLSLQCPTGYVENSTGGCDAE